MDSSKLKGAVWNAVVVNNLWTVLGRFYMISVSCYSNGKSLTNLDGSNGIVAAPKEDFNWFSQSSNPIHSKNFPNGATEYKI